MKRVRIVQFLALIIVAIFMMVACNGGNQGNDGGDVPDLAATQASMELTQAAMAAQPDVPPPATEEVSGGGVIDTTAFGSGDEVFFTDFDGEGDLGDEWLLMPFPSDAKDFELELDGYSNAAFDITEKAMDLLVLYDPELLFFPRNQADVYVEATAYNAGNNNLNYISVVCRYSDEGFYMFSLMSGAKWQIWKYTFGKDWRLLLEGGVQNFDYDAEHTIGGSCIGSNLTLYVDGEQPPKAEYEETSFRDGGVGLGVSSSGRETQVEVLDFTVSIP